MSKKENPSPKADKAVKSAAKADDAAEAKPTGIEKAKKRREDLGKIIAYALKKATPVEGNEVNEEDAAILALAALYAPKAKRARPGTEPTWSAGLRKIMGEATSKHEDSIWNETKSTAPLGRADMQSLIRDAVLREKPEFRFWVRFDIPTRTYTVLGVGPMAPAGWTGKLPKDQAKTDMQRLEDPIA